MKAPVFSAESHLHLCNKSLSYIESSIADGLMRWLDPLDKRKGAIGLRRLNLRQKPKEYHEMMAGPGFSEAWAIRQSGYAGPLVWEMKTR